MIKAKRAGALVLLILLAALLGGVVSQTNTLIVDGNLRPVASTQQLTVSSTAVALTVPTGAKIARIQVLNYNVRSRDDGTNPTSTVGIREFADTEFWYTGDLTAIKFIRESSDAELNIAYYDW